MSVCEEMYAEDGLDKRESILHVEDKPEMWSGVYAAVLNWGRPSMCGGGVCRVR